MRNLNFKQILLLILIFFFLFGDLVGLKKKIKNCYCSIISYFDNADKKNGI
jgi:hypothetical protein